MTHSYYYTLIIVCAMFFASAEPAEAQQRSAVQLDATVQSASVFNDHNVLRNYNPEGGISLQIVNPDAGIGFVFGTNMYGDQAKATFFKAESVIAIESVNFYFGGGTGVGTITVQVVAGNENNGPDFSQVYGSVDFDLSDAFIPEDPQDIEATSIQFDAPVAVNGEFAIVYSWDPEELEEDAFGIASGITQEMRIATEWEQWDSSSWNNVSDAWSGEYDDGVLVFGSGVVGWHQWIDVFYSDAPVSTEPVQTVNGFALEQNYPNPFNPITNISFNLPETSEVSLEVFNMQGQRVAIIANGTMAAGSHNVSFDAANFSSGIYLYRLTAGSFTATNKMMLVK